MFWEKVNKLICFDSSEDKMAEKQNKFLEQIIILTKENGEYVGYRTLICFFIGVYGL